MTPQVKLNVVERHGRKTASSGSPWEGTLGYSRAIRAGDFIFVSGTVGIEADGSYGPNVDVQTRRALNIAIAAIETLGGKIADVVRTRVYLTNIDGWDKVGEVHAEFFGSIRPAMTMVQIARLIDASALVEIEVEAVVQS
jgi:enamine deaminase RidA (YjgF/YER057c/UK114 family)